MKKTILNISFPARVTSSNFEQFLIKHYPDSVSGRFININFDLSLIKWFDIFELSLFCLWLDELIRLNLSVNIKYPEDEYIINFFHKYKIDVFLTSLNISLQGYRLKKSYQLLVPPFIAPSFPLTIFNQDLFNDLITDLCYGDRMSIVLNEIKDAEIVKTGAIRDVILKEIGENVFIHSGQQKAYFIMTRIYRSEWSKSASKNTNELEKEFFKKINNKSYIEIVIADKGEGIFRTLKNAYENDTVMNVKKSEPSEIDVLEYAFFAHSSRRSLKERVGHIFDYLTTEAKEFPPQTGLYRIKEKTRDFHGFLYLRSGASIICFDFYENQLSNRPITNKYTKKLSNLIDFGGTQYKFYFPIEAPQKKQYYFEQIQKMDPPTTSISHFIKLDDFFPQANRDPEYWYQAEQIHNLFEHIEALKLNNESLITRIIIDFSHHFIAQKTLHYILFNFLQSQTELCKFVCINLESDAIKQFKELIRNKKVVLLKPMLVFDNCYSPALVGITNKEDTLFSDLIEKKANQTAEMLLFAKRNEQFFILNSESKNYEFRYPPIKVLRIIRNAMKSEIKAFILNPINKIFHEDFKVLLPAGKYCKGYFEIYRLLDDRKAKALLVAWIKNWILELKPDFIISISGHCGIIINEVIADLGVDSRIKHKNLKTPVNDIDSFKLVFELEQDKKVIIITDVIGTSSTLSSVVKNLRRAKIIKIISFIDASQDISIKIEDNSYDFESVIKINFNYYSQLPSGWQYSEIYQIDPDTHILIKRTAKPGKPLWKSIEYENIDVGNSESFERPINKFIEEVVIPSDCYLEGHFIANEKHMTYLFNIPCILSSFLDEISDVIVDNVQKTLTNIQPSPTISHILYPDFNPGLDLLAEKVSKQFPQSIIVKISANEFRTLHDREYDQYEQEFGAVIVIDDAFVSGDTIFRIIDIAERKGASHVLSYVIIKRGIDYLARRLEKISQYGKAVLQTRYLVDAEIPTYSLDNCPICKQIEELEELNKKIDLPILNDLIEQDIAKLADRPVSSVIGDEFLIKSSSFSQKRADKIRYRWKLELAKTTLESKKDLASTVRQYKNDQHEASVIEFFKVLAQEKESLLLNVDTRKRIFYKTFEPDIIEACKYYCNRLNLYSEEEINAILHILRSFDEDYFISSLAKLVENTIQTMPNFLRVILHSLLSKEARKYPGRIKKVFQAVSINNELVTYLSNYWSDREIELREYRTERLQCFRDLLGGIFHEIGHLSSNIVKESKNRYEKIVPPWLILDEEIKTIIPKLRIVIGSNISSAIVGQLEERINKIEFQMSEGNKIITTKDNMQIESIADIKRIVETTNSLIYDKQEGIIALLNHLKTDLKHVLHRVVQQERNELDNKRVGILKEFPDEACIVFGESVRIGTLFQNLIENVWKHSRANMLRIELKIISDENRLKIIILDNGIGVGLFKEKDYGHGLNNVKEVVQSYCGEFELREIENNDNYYKDGYRTQAIIKLPYLGEDK